MVSRRLIKPSERVHFTRKAKKVRRMKDLSLTSRENAWKTVENFHLGPT